MSATVIRPAILVVEDETVLRMNAVSMLEDGGYDVVEAADAREALAQLESRPDVGTLFTDINMPGRMDGCALAYAVIALRPDVRILITSGKGLPDKGITSPKPPPSNVYSFVPGGQDLVPGGGGTHLFCLVLTPDLLDMWWRQKPLTIQCQQQE